MVTAVGDFLWSGTEEPTCRPAEVFFFPGVYQACHRETTKPRTILYYPLVFHTGTSGTPRSGLGSTKDRRAVAAAVGDSEAQVVFSSIAPVNGKGSERGR